MQTSETPETDAAEFPVMTWPSVEHPLVVSSTLARKLETERDELKKRFTRLDEPRYSGSPMMDDILVLRNPDFDEWLKSVPATYWARYDLSAARIGWEAACKYKKDS